MKVQFSVVDGVSDLVPLICAFKKEIIVFIWYIMTYGMNGLTSDTLTQLEIAVKFLSVKELQSATPENKNDPTAIIDETPTCDQFPAKMSSRYHTFNVNPFS